VYFNWAVGAKDNGTYETFRPLNILGIGDKTSVKTNSGNVGIGRKSWRSKYNPKESVNVTKIYFNGVVLERHKVTDGDMMRVRRRSYGNFERMPMTDRNENKRSSYYWR
jgi:hypothetical protein